jgi:succinoglycan biosynthesis transport protein ExoP
MDDGNQIELFQHGQGALDRRRGALFTPPDAFEVDQGPDIVAYWRILRKRRRTILAVLAVLFAVVAVWTLRQKPVYRAKALIEIEKENPSILTAQDLFTTDSVSDTFLETQYKILKSDALAESVIVRLGMEQMPEFAPAVPWQKWMKSFLAQAAPVQGAAAARNSGVPQRTLDRFQDRLEVTPIRRSRLLTISFESQDPELAARVVNTIASDYMEQSLKVRWDASQRASEWLTRQLADLKTKLEISENELQTYATENGLLFLENGNGSNENIVNERLRQLQEELTKAQAARYEKESFYRLVQSGDYASLPGVFENKLIQDLTMQSANLQEQAAQLTITFNASYPKVKQIQNQIKEVDAVLARERKHAAQRITDDYTAALNREKLVRQDFQAQQKQANLVAERSVQYNILKREVDTTKNVYEGLLQHLKEAGASVELKASDIRVVDPAKPPSTPTRPNVPLNLALGLLLGLGLGVGLAFLQESMDKTVKSPDEVERFLRLSPLAHVPTVHTLNGRRHLLPRDESGRLPAEPRSNGKHTSLNLSEKTPPRVDLRAPTQAALSEAFRSLCASVLLSASGRPPSSILIASAQPGEGKTMVAINMAVALAELGQRVLLIDADLRCPAIQKSFEIRGRCKLSSYLAGGYDWRRMAQGTGINGLDVLLCGPVPPNPVELLASKLMRRLLWEARQEYKFVILDSPPLLNVADGRILASQVEGVILVVKSGVTPRALVQRAESYLRTVGANVVGVVLNNFDSRDDSFAELCRYDYYTPKLRAH